MLFKPTLTGVALAAALLVTAGPAKSANVNFHDLLDTVTVDATQFDVTPATITHMNLFGGEDDVRVTGQFFTNSPDSTGGNTTALFEPELPLGTVSEFIRSNWSVSGMYDKRPSRTYTPCSDFSRRPGCFGSLTQS